MQTEVKKKSWHLPDGKQKGILIWGSVIFFTLLYLSLILITMYGRTKFSA